MVAKLDHCWMSPRLWKSQMLHRSSCSLSWTQGSMRRALCIPSLKLKFTWIQEVFFLFDVKPNNSCHFVWTILSKKALKWVPFRVMIFIAIDIVRNARGARERYNFGPQAYPKELKQEYVKAALVFLPQPSAWLLTQRATFVPDMCPAWDLVAAFCLTTPSGALHNVVQPNPLKALVHQKNTQTLMQHNSCCKDQIQEIVPLINRQMSNKGKNNYKDDFTHNEQAG